MSLSNYNNIYSLIDVEPVGKDFCVGSGISPMLGSIPEKDRSSVQPVQRILQTGVIIIPTRRSASVSSSSVDGNQRPELSQSKPEP